MYSSVDVPNSAYHEQDGVGAVATRHERLHGVDDEVLLQHRHVDSVSHVGQVGETAPIVLLFVSTLIAAAPPSW